MNLTPEYLSHFEHGPYKWDAANRVIRNRLGTPAAGLLRPIFPDEVPLYLDYFNDCYALWLLTQAQE